MELPEPGDLFEQYEVGEVLGTGGFARIYAARTREIGREIALKVLLPTNGSYDARLVSRFMREARAVAALHDPHTLRLYNFGRSESGLLYIAFERLGGEDLATLLKRRGTLNADETVHIVRQILLSLREAHHAGLLHRDIKPGNIRVFEHLDDPLTVKVLDFGIAKSIVEPDTPLTRTGHIVGTPRYMSPEQLLGDDDLGPASDIYSVGLLAYDMVVGLGARGVPSMSELALPDDAPVGPALREVIAGMLEPMAEDRFSSCEKVLDALDTAARHPDSSHTSVATPTPAPRRMPRRRRSHSSDGGVEAVQTSSWRRWMLALSVLFVGSIAALYIDSRNEEPLPPRPNTPRELSPGLLRGGDRPDLATTKMRAEAPDAAQPTDTTPPALPDCDSEIAPGHHVISEVVGIDRTEWPVYVPPGYSGERRHPLVLLIHDQAATPGELIRHRQLVAVADANDLVLFAPEDPPLNPWRTVEDVARVREGLSGVTQRLCVDPDRIYAIGHGRGASFVERLGCEVDFTAIATTNHTRSVDNKLRCERQLPLINIVGREDPYHPIEGGRNCANTARESVAQHEEFRSARRQCGDVQRVDVGEDSVCLSWNCDIPFVSCRVEGGHNWDGMGDRIIDAQFCESDDSKFNYPAAIWEFFDTMKISGK